MAKKQKLPFKAVLFDIDDTLCNTSESKYKVFSRIHDGTRKFQKVSKEKFVEFLTTERDKYLKSERGHQTFARIDLWIGICKTLKIDLNLRELKKVIDDYWKFSLEELVIFPEAKDILEKITKSGITTAVLAGGEFYTKISKLIKLSIDRYFKYVFTSDLLKLAKTNSKIYSYVARYLKMKTKDILIVGNDPKQDITPANQAGMSTVQTLIYGGEKIAKRGYARPNFAVYRLSGLLEIIGIH